MLRHGQLVAYRLYGTRLASVGGISTDHPSAQSLRPKAAHLHVKANGSPAFRILVGYAIKGQLLRLVLDHQIGAVRYQSDAHARHRMPASNVSTWCKDCGKIVLKFNLQYGLITYSGVSPSTFCTLQSAPACNSTVIVSSPSLCSVDQCNTVLLSLSHIFGSAP